MASAKTLGRIVSSWRNDLNTIDRVVMAVAKTYGHTVEELRGRKRDERISSARQVVWYISNIEGVKIGRIAGDFHRSWSTVGDAIRVVDSKAEISDQLREEIFDIKDSIGAECG